MSMGSVTIVGTSLGLEIRVDCGASSGLLMPWLVRPMKAVRAGLGLVFGPLRSSISLACLAFSAIAAAPVSGGGWKFGGIAPFDDIVFVAALNPAFAKDASCGLEDERRGDAEPGLKAGFWEKLGVDMG